MLPRCGSFRSLLPHTLILHSDLARELPGFLSREGSWHFSSYAVQSGMLPSPTCLHRDWEKMPLPVVINCKPFEHSHSLSCMAAGALYEMLWDRREGVGLPSFVYLIDTLALGFSPLFRSLWRWLILRCKENVLMEMQAGSGRSLSKHRSLYWLSSSPFSLFCLSLFFFLYFLSSFGEKKNTHTQKRSMAGN